MEPKVKAIINVLNKLFKSGDVDYRFDKELHKFRLERNGPSLWLYVSRNFVDDHTENEIIERITHWQIPDILLCSNQNRWLFLSEDGVKEVSDSFGR
jgi:hypothetical protein